MKENWLRKNYKWLVPVTTLLIVIIYLFSSSGFGKISKDLAQAYSDKQLYHNAIKKVNNNKMVLELLGEIQPIDKMTILNGEVSYSNNNMNIDSTIKIQGTKGDAKLDLRAHRKKNKWVYDQIKVRIKDPSENAQTIDVVKSEFP